MSCCIYKATFAIVVIIHRYFCLDIGEHLDAAVEIESILLADEPDLFI